MSKKEKEQDVEGTAKIVNPQMENKVERNVDFNLKKEDLMLLILEGRKEAMEEVIAKLQKSKNELFLEVCTKQKALEDAIRTTLLKALSPVAKKLAKTYNAGASTTELDENSVQVKLSLTNIPVAFVTYGSNPINLDNTSRSTGGTYIKTETRKETTIQLAHAVTYSMTLSLAGEQFLQKNDLFTSESPKPCVHASQTFKIGEESLNIAAQKELKEYKELFTAVESYNKVYSDMTNIMAEYDLFSRNQPRAKASMIKEVLGRDDAGKALLENLSQASKGMKLLG